MKKYIIITTILLATVSLYSQQDSQFSQYMYNTINVNPAYAGSRGLMSIFGFHHTPLPKNTGLGVSVIKDAIGAQDQTKVAADFSYTIPVSENTKLSFGIKGSLNMQNIDFTKLNIKDPTDPRLQQNIDNRFNPNIGAGAYLHSENGYVGLSVPQIIETQHYDGYAKENINQIATERLHYYLIGGYVFKLNDNLKFKPATLTKVVLGAPLQVDLSANFLINQKFTAGLAYRSSNTMSALLGFQITEQFYAGYSYDLETSKLATYNYGSHEVFLRYELFNNIGKAVSPRFF